MTRKTKTNKTNHKTTQRKRQCHCQVDPPTEPGTDTAFPPQTVAEGGNGVCLLLFAVIVLDFSRAGI